MKSAPKTPPSDPGLSSWLDEELETARIEAKSKPKPPPADAGCPSCNGPLAPGTVVCVQCGYDTRIRGKRSVQRDGSEEPAQKRSTLGSAASLLRGTYFSFLGAMVGAFIWALLTYLTMYEFSFVALGLGGLAGPHPPGPDLPRMLDTLEADAARVVVHHFGRPQAQDPEDDSGFARLTRFGPGDPVWIKCSAHYRLPGLDAARYGRALLDHFGPDHLLWGSDWPWTEHEAMTGFADCLARLAAWTGPGPDTGRRIDRAARALYGFD